MQQHEGVQWACQGTCGHHYQREAVKVADGRMYCAACYPRTVPAVNVKVPHKRGPKLKPFERGR